MGSLGGPNSRIPYMLNTTDCSQGFCSYYCPQWCYITIPPPPPLEFPSDSSGPNFSPLIIAIIGILASGFLLVSYYTLISKCCGNTEPSTRESIQHNIDFEGSHNPSYLQEPWQDSTIGLDEALIKSITVCKYKKGDGLVEGTCSVCLNEFQEDESIRLLPKCTHAFHIPCIDTWLRSHSNCPLCRSSIAPIHASPIEVLPSVTQSLPPGHEAATRSLQVQENVTSAEDIESRNPEDQRIANNAFPKTTLRALSDLGSLQGRDTIIEVRDEGCLHNGRSYSMDHSCETLISIADILRMDEDEDIEATDHRPPVATESSEQRVVEGKKSCQKKRASHKFTSPVAMRRSFSSGRFFHTTQGRMQNAIIPL